MLKEILPVLLTIHTALPAVSTPDNIELPKVSNPVSHVHIMRSVKNKISSALVMSDEAQNFLGLPMLTKLANPTNPLYDYYLLGLRWNVPLIKRNLPLKYKQILFEGKVSLQSYANDPAPIAPRIVGIYPTNQYITDTVQNVTNIAGQFSPEWNGAAVGSISGSNHTVQTFTVELPVLAGIATPDGTVRWALYPSKNQQIFLGNKTVFVLLQVPKNMPKTCVVFNGTLKYDLKNLPLSSGNYSKNCSLDLRTAVDFDEFLNANALELGTDMVTGLKRAFSKIQLPTKE